MGRFISRSEAPHEGNLFRQGFLKKKISESQDLQSNYVVTHIAGFLGKCSKFYEKSSNKLDHIQVRRS